MFDAIASQKKVPQKLYSPACGNFSVQITDFLTPDTGRKRYIVKEVVKKNLQKGRR
jgi:hypothetical protein